MFGERLDGLGVDGDDGRFEDAGFDETHVCFDEQIFDDGMIGFFEKAVELCVVRQNAVFEAAEDFEKWIGFEKSDEGGDSCETFEAANDECAKKGVLRSAVDADAGVKIGECVEVERGEKVFILFDNGGVREMIEGDKKWKLKFHKRFLRFWV